MVRMSGASRPVVVSRYRRPRSHEHSGRQAKVAASSLHTFTPGGSPLFQIAGFRYDEGNHAARPR